MTRVVGSWSAKWRIICLINLDDDALGDQVFLDHVGEGLTFGVLRRRPLYQRSRVEIGLAAELLDAFGDFVGVFALGVGVFLELIAHGHGMNAGGHEVVVHVAQHANDLRSQRFVQNGDGLLRRHLRRCRLPRRLRFFLQRACVSLPHRSKNLA